VATNDARYLAALTNVPTLQSVVTAGNTATNIGDLTIAGRVVNGTGLNVANISADANGAQQAGYNIGTMTIGAVAYGASQSGLNQGTMTIGVGAKGAQQDGYSEGTMTIASGASGAQQGGYSVGTMTIGYEAHGAQQRGYVESGAFATNNADGAVQLLNLSAGQSATITADGSASIGLGACVVSNKQSIVAGDGQVSHGNGSITAGGGFYGSGANLTGITATQVAAVPTNRTITIDGVTKPLDADVSFTTSGGGTTFAQVTQIVNTVNSEIFWVTNTVTVSNSLNFAIPLAGNNVRVRWMAMFLSATNEAAASKRASFSIYTHANRLCDSAVYIDTNQLYLAAPSTSAQAAGAATGTVVDATGVVLYDRYAVGNGVRWDFLTATSTTATVIYYGCTNKFSTTADANTKISHANYLTPVFYDDDTAQTSMWCRLAWTTPYTGTVTTIMRYSK
jgi:hypothetical protein